MAANAAPSNSNSTSTSTAAPPLPSASSAAAASDLKRKRSSSHEGPAHSTAPAHKTAKTHGGANNSSSHHLQINYLARQFNEDLPLVSNDDTLPTLLAILGDYQGVLDRHESMACNLGARPIGPILVKRFERLFDAPPRVLKTHNKDGLATVTWLDVVEFARNKPEQFSLAQMSEGLRVCQFYTKQCRVQISEEDFVLISSGIPQKMIPPQPIIEDEDKELGTIDVLEKNLGSICHLADQVAARTRQLNHRLKGRKQAILDRRATDNPPAVRASSPSNVALMNGAGQTSAPAIAGLTASPPSSFVAVNSNRSSSSHHGNNSSPAQQHHHHHQHHHHNQQQHQQQQQQQQPPGRHHDRNGGVGEPATSASKGSAAPSPARHEILSQFFTLNDRRSQPMNGESTLSTPGRRSSNAGHHASSSTQSARPQKSGSAATTAAAAAAAVAAAAANVTANASSAQHPQHQNSSFPTESELAALLNPDASPIAVPVTPSNTSHQGSSNQNQSQTNNNNNNTSSARSANAEKDDGGPYKLEMVSRMESLAKGDRIIPPCDRCRRLHMDCLKNLTACMGCTKKHAKCSWREVRDYELENAPPVQAAAAAPSSPSEMTASGPLPESNAISSSAGPATSGGYGVGSLFNREGDDEGDRPSVGQVTPPPPPPPSAAGQHDHQHEHHQQQQQSKGHGQVQGQQQVQQLTCQRHHSPSSLNADRVGASEMSAKHALGIDGLSSNRRSFSYEKHQQPSPLTSPIHDMLPPPPPPPPPSLPPPSLPQPLQQHQKQSSSSASHSIPFSQPILQQHPSDSVLGAARESSSDMDQSSRIIDDGGFGLSRHQALAQARDEYTATNSVHRRAPETDAEAAHEYANAEEQLREAARKAELETERQQQQQHQKHGDEKSPSTVVKTYEDTPRDHHSGVSRASIDDADDGSNKGDNVTGSGIGSGSGSNEHGNEHSNAKHNGGSENDHASASANANDRTRPGEGIRTLVV